MHPAGRVPGAIARAIACCDARCARAIPEAPGTDARARSTRDWLRKRRPRTADIDAAGRSDAPNQLATPASVRPARSRLPYAPPTRRSQTAFPRRPAAGSARYPSPFPPNPPYPPPSDSDGMPSLATGSRVSRGESGEGTARLALPPALPCGRPAGERRLRQSPQQAVSCLAGLRRPTKQNRGEADTGTMLFAMTPS